MLFKKKYSLLESFLLQAKIYLSTTRFKGEEPDPVAVATLTATLHKKLDAYEKILSKRKYLAGDVIILFFFFTFAYIVNFYFSLTLLTVS